MPYIVFEIYFSPLFQISALHMKNKSQNEILGILIRKKRKERQLTQKEMGEWIGKGKSYISKIESGNWSLKNDLLDILIEKMWPSTDHFLLELNCMKKTYWEKMKK